MYFNAAHFALERFANCGLNPLLDYIYFIVNRDLIIYNNKDRCLRVCLSVHCFLKRPLRAWLQDLSERYLYD